MPAEAGGYRDTKYSADLLRDFSTKDSKKVMSESDSDASRMLDEWLNILRVPLCTPCEGGYLRNPLRRGVYEIEIPIENLKKKNRNGKIFYQL